MNRAPNLSHELDEHTMAALRASVLRESLADYAVHFWPVVTGRALEPNRAITEAVAVLQRVADGELHRVLIAMPSGVGKSTLLALYSGWRLARNPGHRAIHMMHASSLAGTESLRVRRLVESDEHRRLFPSLRLRPDESTVAAWRTMHDGAYYAVGRDSALLGRRAHEAVLDDPADVGDRFSPSAKAALWAWLQESLMTRLDGDFAPIVVVHQRTSVDDLIGKLAEQRDGRGNRIWLLLSLPAEDDEGNLLAPTILSREKLDGLKANNPRVYKAMFLQAPDADDGAAIPRKAWRFHAPSGSNMRAARPDGCASPDESPTVVTPAAFRRIVVSVDPTFGGTKSANDFCAIHAWGESDGSYYLLDRWLKKAKQLDQREALKQLVARVERNFGRVHRLLIEKTAGGGGLIEQLEAEGVRSIEPVTPLGSKAERLEHVTPTIERGFAYLLLGMHDLGELVEQSAGAAAHDDDPDAAQIALHWFVVHGAGDPRARHDALSRIGWLMPPASRTHPPQQPSHADVEHARVREHLAREHEARMRILDARERATGVSLGDRELEEWRARRSEQQPPTPNEGTRP